MILLTLSYATANAPSDAMASNETANVKDLFGNFRHVPGCLTVIPRYDGAFVDQN